MNVIQLLIICNMILAVSLVIVVFITQKPQAQVKKTYKKASHHSKGVNPKTSKGLKAYWARMTKEERIAEIKRRGQVAADNKKKKSGYKAQVVRNGWQRKRISKAVKNYWDNLTPEQRSIRIDKMRRTRELNKLLKENNAFHGPK